MEKRVSGGSPHVALLHHLSNRLTAARNYLTAVQHSAATEAPQMNPPAAEILQRALAQLDQAGAIVLQLGKMFDGSLHVERGNGRCYRVRFMNRFARGRNTISACQRSVVIPSAEWREAAIETAKRCFAELEGIPDWTLHATFIEAELLEDDTADRWQQHSADIPYAINTGTTEELQ